MGLGKTAITLTALYDLLFDYFEITRVLVIAPLRVARNTWPQEIEKWDHLKDVCYSVAVGTEKERLEAFRRDADIYIINRENVQWMVENVPFEFDAIVVDELSSFKNWNSKRFKSLMKVRPRAKPVSYTHLVQREREVGVLLSPDRLSKDHFSAFFSSN